MTDVTEEKTEKEETEETCLCGCPAASHDWTGPCNGTVVNVFEKDALILCWCDSYRPRT